MLGGLGVRGLQGGAALSGEVSQGMRVDIAGLPCEPPREKDAGWILREDGKASAAIAKGGFSPRFSPKN